MDEQMHAYLDRFVAKKADWVQELEKVAVADNVPIMESVAIDFMLNQIKIHKPTRILEVGTAIGYSALRMLEASPTAQLITIERDEERYLEATEVIKQQKKAEQITVRFGDALDVLQTITTEKQTFDFIFIDAAKGKYREFFNLVHPLLKPGGLLVTDNVLFRGFVTDHAAAPKRYRRMVRKIDEYNRFVSNHPDYITSILPIGDGVMLSYKHNGADEDND